MNILQKAIRSMYSLTGSFNDKLLKYYKQYGATSSVLQDAEKQYLVGRLGNKYYANQDYWKELDATFGDALPLEVSDILRKYGNDAHLYLPGVSPSQGFIPGNYIDSAGTQPAVYDQPVGLVLDAAGSVGAECYPNGFAGSSLVGGATLIGAVASLPVASSQVLPPGFSAVAGATYKITVDLTTQVGSYLNIYIGNSPVFGVVMGAFVGRKTVFIKANNANGLILQNDSGASGGITSATLVECKEITGIHASQQTVGYKPIERRGIVNLLTYSNDLTNGAYQTQNGATKSGQTLNIASAGASAYHMTTAPVGTNTFAIVVSGSGTIKFWMWGATDGEKSPLIITLTDTPTLYAISATGAGLMYGFFGNAETTATSVTIGGYGLFAGTLAAAQIIEAGGIPMTTTAPASSSAGNAYLEFDGVDDRLAIPSMGFTDTVAVVLAVNLSRANVVQVLFGSDSGGPQIYSSTDGAVIFDKNGEGHIAGTPAGAISVGVPAVFTFMLSGGQALVRKNGVDVSSLPSARVFTSTVAHALGSQPSGQYPIKGFIYKAALLKSTLSLADVQQLERFAAQRAGIQL